MNLHIYYKHDFDTEKYRQKYPDAPLKSSDRLQAHVRVGRETADKKEKFTGDKTGDKNPFWKGGKISKPCHNCGKTLQRHPSEFENKAYCSKKCESEWRSKNWPGTDKIANFEGMSHTEATKQHMSEITNKDHRSSKNPNWRGGRSFEPYPPAFNSRLKEYIRDLDNRTCQLCGVDESNIDGKLNVHHIDYVKNNLSIMNLISLCRSCHSKTHTDRIYWSLFFRIHINNRFRAGGTAFRQRTLRIWLSSRCS